MATFYYNGQTDNDWSTLNNWWMTYDPQANPQFSNQAIALPNSTDDVIAYADINSNSGSNPIITNFTLNQTSALNITVTVTGQCIFNDNSYNNMGVIIGNCIFKNSSYNNGIIEGNATFQQLSANRRGISGNIILAYNRGINDSSILGVI